METLNSFEQFSLVLLLVVLPHLWAALALCSSIYWVLSFFQVFQIKSLDNKDINHLREVFFKDKIVQFFKSEKWT